MPGFSNHELARIGVRPGGMLLLHAAEFAEAALDPLLDFLGLDGTLLLPAFSLKGKLDPLAESLCRRRGVQLSAHPTFPFAAIGSRAGLLVRDHHLHDPFGFDSPVGRAYRFGGQLLSIGDDPRSNAVLRLAASLTRSPASGCQSLSVLLTPLRREGSLFEGTVDGLPACCMAIAAAVNTASRLFCKEPELLRCQDPHCRCHGTF